MLFLHQSNRLEVLAGGLAGRLAADPPSPLEAAEVVVPHPGMGRWLSLRLADALGVCANTRFPLPAGFVWGVFSRLFDDIPRDNRFAPAVMAWGILHHLKALREDPRFAPVARYLADGDALKAYQFASRLALLFDRYLVYRPDWILAWERGDGAVEGDAWQAELWRRLSAGGAHWVHLQERFFALDDAEIRLRLPRRLSLFGIPTLSPGYLEVLRRLSEAVEVELFLLNPCADEWGGVVSEDEEARLELAADGAELYLEVGNPLLGSLGRQGRDLFAILQDYDPGAGGEGFEAAADDTLLGRLQNDILRLRGGHRALAEGETPDAPAPWPADDLTLQIHACHSPMREAEALYDQLLELFRRDPGLQPADVLVMVPDMDRYAPALEAVFSESGDRPGIPYSLSDRGLSAESPLVESFFRLLELPRGRFELDAMAALLETPAVARRFGLPEAELPRLLHWLHDAGIRWGRDGAHRAELGLPATQQNSWRAGLDRLLLGYAMRGEDWRLFDGRLPYDEVEGGGADLAGGAAAFAETLFELQTELQRPLDPAGWAARLNRLLDRCFAPDQEEEAQVQALRDALAALVEEMELAGYRDPVELEVLLLHLRTLVEQAGGGHRFLAGGVTLCTLTPMRALPFKAVCLVGLNDGAFPRDERPLGFDLMAKHFRLGDRSRRADDRYLFLEALISARHYLYISYTGLDLRDNSPKPPSVLVDELLDYLDTRYLKPEGDPKKVRERLVVHHPLQPFSRRYFAGHPRLFSYSRELSELARTRGEQGLPNFVPKALPEPDAEWRQIELGQLLRFIAGPVRYFLRERLGVQIEEGAEELESREPRELPYFEGLALEERLLAACLEGGDAQELMALERARGLLPHGGWGDQTFVRLWDQVARFAEETAPKLPAGPPQGLGLHFRHQALTLDGTLDGITDQGLHHCLTRAPWANERLAFWVRHLALNLLDLPAAARHSRWFSQGGLLTLRPLEPDEAVAAMGDLLEAYWAGLREPLPLFPKASWAYMQELHAKGERAKAMKRAGRAWSDSRSGSGSKPGEWAKPYHRLAFPTGEALGETFETLAQRLLGPIFAHMEETP